MGNTLAIKRWWNLRTSHTLWSSFITNKYCINRHHVAKTWRSGQSHAWKHLLSFKDQAEKNIIWYINKEDSKFWWDNWTGKGALAKLHPYLARSHKIQVSDYIIQGTWNIAKLTTILPLAMVNYIYTLPIGKRSGRLPYLGSL